MLCKNCGTPLEENAAVCEICGGSTENTPPAAEALPEGMPTAPAEALPEDTLCAPADTIPPQPAKRRKPHILLRVLLQLLSLCVSLALCISLVAAVALADLNQIMSAGSIQKLVNAILTPVSAPHRTSPAVGALGIRWAEATAPADTTAPAEDSFTVPGDLELDDIPEDLLSGGSSEENMNGLIDWIYDKVMESTDGGLSITREQMQIFVEESTIYTYAAEKLAGYAEDFLNGTANTTITTEEVLQLLNENMPLLEKTFDMKLSVIQKQVLTTSVKQLLEETDINAVIREQIFTSVEESINSSVSDTGMTWEQLQPMLQTLCADSSMYAGIGVCVGLVLLLCLLNFYNVPAGLTWSAFPCILVGTVLTLPLKLLPSLSQLIPDELSVIVMPVLRSFSNILLPIHSVVPVAGVALLVISIVWRIIRACVRRKRRLAAA